MTDVKKMQVTHLIQVTATIHEKMKEKKIAKMFKVCHNVKNTF